MKKSMLFYLLFLNLSTPLSSSGPITQAKTSPAQVDITTPKTFTCFEKLPRALQFIIADYAGLNSSQKNGSSPLQNFITCNDFPAVAILINCGALVNSMPAKNQRTPLFLAVLKIHELSEDDYYESHENEIKNLIKIIQFLILKKADIDQRSPAESYETALHKAIYITDSSTTLDLLIHAGVNPNIKNRFGQTTLDEVEYQAFIHHETSREKEQYQNYCKTLEAFGAKKSIELKLISSGCSSHESQS